MEYEVAKSQSLVTAGKKQKESKENTTWYIFKYGLREIVDNSNS